MEPIAACSVFSVGSASTYVGLTVPPLAGNAPLGLDKLAVGQPQAAGYLIDGFNFVGRDKAICIGQGKEQIQQPRPLFGRYIAGKLAHELHGIQLRPHFRERHFCHKERFPLRQPTSARAADSTITLNSASVTC